MLNDLALKNKTVAIHQFEIPLFLACNSIWKGLAYLGILRTWSECEVRVFTVKLRWENFLGCDKNKKISGLASWGLALNAIKSISKAIFSKLLKQSFGSYKKIRNSRQGFQYEISFPMLVRNY